MYTYTRHIEREARGGHLCGGDYDCNLLAQICANMKRNAHTEGHDSTQHIQRNTFYATHSTQHTQRDTFYATHSTQHSANLRQHETQRIVQYQTRCMHCATSNTMHDAVSHTIHSWCSIKQDACIVLYQTR